MTAIARQANIAHRSTASRPSARLVGSLAALLGADVLFVLWIRSAGYAWVIPVFIAVVVSSALVASGWLIARHEPDGAQASVRPG